MDRDDANVLVAISTGGRFHLFPFARELVKRRSLVAIFSGFPWLRLRKEGVPRRLVWTFPLFRPLLMCLRYLPIAPPKLLSDFIHSVSVVAQDWYVSMRLPVCDIFVGHEAVGLKSGSLAQSRGAIYVCDRGCSHMAWKEELLFDERQYLGLKQRSRPLTYSRELREYAQSDYIVVGSSFAKQSFIEKGFSEKKIHVVPYGVDRDVFQPRAVIPDDDVFNVIFVGNLNIRKGARYLLEGFEQCKILKKQLTIVGLVDDEVKQSQSSQLHRSDVTLLGHCVHEELPELLSKSDVLVLPSIEEGFGMVVTEALACGCPVIVSENTGAKDVVVDGKNGFIIPIRSSSAITNKLDLIGGNRRLRAEMSAAALLLSVELGWDRYADRMLEWYDEILSKQKCN
jgi:starch synthase